MVGKKALSDRERDRKTVEQIYVEQNLRDKQKN